LLFTLGIPEHVRAQTRSAPVATPATGASGTGVTDIEQLRQHPQFNTLKQLIQQNPAALPQVLSLIGQQSPGHYLPLP
jgi:UV excision repair protein RAD23